eukprot:sb/3476540/
MERLRRRERQRQRETEREIVFIRLSLSDLSLYPSLFLSPSLSLPFRLFLPPALSLICLSVLFCVFIASVSISHTCGYNAAIMRLYCSFYMRQKCVYSSPNCASNMAVCGLTFMVLL